LIEDNQLMAKQKGATTQQDPGPIAEFNEWQEHQYNPYYWVNRFSDSFFKRKRSKGALWIILFELLIYLMAFFAVFYVYLLLGRPPGLLILLGILGVPCILLILHAFYVKPLPTEPKPDEQNEDKRKNRRKKKRGLPKRPKNYQ